MNKLELVNLKEYYTTQIELTRANILALYEELEEEFNRGKFYSQDRADRIQADIAIQDAIQNKNYEMLNKVEAMLNEEVSPVEEVQVVEVTQEEKSVAEVIADELYKQGYLSERQGDSLTVQGHDYEVSITVLDKCFELETYNSHAIEHFNTYEWANHKVVKTLKGLNGYLRRYLGTDPITL